MDAEHQSLRKEPLLPPGGANDSRRHVVRVVINPSALDRFLRGPPYYFYDDVPVPYERLLVGADRPMLPSQRERLLQRGGGESEGAMFGHLWMLFCARLSQTKARNYPRDRRRLLCLLCGLWFCAVVSIVMQIVVADDLEIEQLMLGFFAVGTMTLLPLTIRFADVTERQVQELVDEMAPLFAEEGFHVDLIGSSSHTPMYVRFVRASSATITSSSSLQESMLKFQEQARHDHEDALIDQRQVNLRENDLMPARIFGIRLEALREWESAIRTCTVIFGFIFSVCTVLIFLSFEHFLLDIYSPITPWRNQKLEPLKMAVEYSDDLDYTP